MHAVRRGMNATRAMCMEAGPESESRAEAQWGMQLSWESRCSARANYRNGAEPVDQRPCRQGEVRILPERTSAPARGTGSEGDRSERDTATSSLSGPIVAMESRETQPEGSL